jgi:hypothetical protein
MLSVNDPRRHDGTTFETSVTTDQSKRRNNPESFNIQQHRCEHLKNGMKRSNYISSLSVLLGHAVAQLVEALRYKPKGRGFDSR